MDENNSIQLFEDRKIRTAWDEEQEEWYFSVQDVVAVLSESTDPKQYIKKMRTRDPQLSANWGTICTPVQMLAADGKQRKVQAANTEGILRIIQSIPSPKAEPFKRWLAQVGRERIEETIDPEQAIDRALETYQKKGYDADWIHQRILSIRVRNELTAEWQARGVEQGREYAILGLVRHDHPAIQKSERSQKGKPPGQHEHIGDRAEHAGRNHDYGAFQGPPARGL